MKILQVIHSIDPQGGGPIEGIKQLAPALAARGVETEVMSLDAPDSPGLAGFPLPLHPTGPSRFGYGYTPRAMPWLAANRRNYDAVLVNGLWQYGSFAVWRALRGTSTPYFVYPHGMLDPWFKRRYPLKHLKKWLYWPWAEYRVLRDATAVLFTTEEEKLEARRSFPLYRCREEVAGYGIASPPEDAGRQLSYFFERHPELKGKRLILFLGRLHEKKGCDLLLRAWKKVLSSFPSEKHEGLHLIMAGPCDSSYGVGMKKLAGDLGIEESLTWPGMVAGELKWGCLRAAEAFVLPSHQENFGVAVVEALACGLPVLVSNKVNIWREIAQDHAGLVENDDLAGTARLLERWLELPPTERGSMRDQARNCFSHHFEISGVAETLIILLRSYTV